MNTQSQPIPRINKLIPLPNKNLSVSQLAICLNVLAKQHKLSLPILIRMLDRVSGDITNLQKVVMNRDKKCQWTKDQDRLLETNQSLLIRWKGKQQVQKRKKYLGWSKNREEIQAKQIKEENNIQNKEKIRNKTQKVSKEEEKVIDLQ